MKPTEKRFFKIILYTVLSIVVLIVTLNILAGSYVRNLLQKSLSENTSIPYTITFSRASVNILTRSFHLQDIKVVDKPSTDSTLSNKIDLQIASLNISGISYSKLFLKKILRIGSIELNEPVIHITDFDTIPSKKDSTEIVNLYTLIKDQVHSVRIEKFGINKGSVTLSSRDTTDLLVSVTQWNLEVSNIRADSTLMSSEKMFEA
ncbi:MAG TPA: hypothetical protein PLD84_12005, partial [Chitinophagales bacterium]|nr:hypothetical protein [Chitinophagales bacterium]